MFITQRRFDEEINKAYMRGYYDGKKIGEMGAERKQNVAALKKEFNFSTDKEAAKSLKKLNKEFVNGNN